MSYEIAEIKTTEVLHERLRAANFPPTLDGRAEFAFNTYRELYPNEAVVDVFPTSHLGPSDERQYESLWFFTPNFMYEVKNLTGDLVNFDASLIRNNVARWEVEAAEYDLTSLAYARARLKVQLWTADAVVAELRTHGEWCPVLWDIIKRHVVPNLSAESRSTGTYVKAGAQPR